MRKGVMSTVCAAMMALLPASCGDTMSEYSTYPCRFVFNTATHAHSAALGSAVGGTGIFCKVTTVIKGGARHYRFTTNSGVLCLRRRVPQLLQSEHGSGEKPSAECGVHRHRDVRHVSPRVQHEHRRKHRQGRQRQSADALSRHVQSVRSGRGDQLTAVFISYNLP